MLTKARAAITQLTAAGTSGILDVSGGYNQVLLLKHSNGTGAVTTAATYTVQLRTAGGSLWYALGTFTASTIAAAVDDLVVAIPDAIGAVRVVYASPAGPGGYTLDAEVGEVTGV